ncbi:MAG: cysteine--tRNA ligase [Thermoplasmataceae archaeon]
MIYNTFTSSKEEFKSINGKRVNMFVCGITPYDSPHIGNLRTFIYFDVIAKYLKVSGFDVFYLQNITDLDDKIITRSNETGIPAMELSDSYLREYAKNMSLFSINSVSLYARATTHIPEMIRQISKLEKKGYTYKLEDGIYFHIEKFPDYGALSGQKLEALRTGTRAKIADDKKNSGDFVLWKFRKSGEPYWESPWGEGRPGWNVEDTAITEEYFGDVYDIHGGGTDLIFPHHEGEIAIMRSISDMERLSNYWMHTGMLTVNGQKMSKSLGNFLTASDLLKDFSPSEIRFSMMLSHYRSIADFSKTLLEESKANLGYIKKALRILENHQGTGSAIRPDDFMRKIKESMDDDFNTRGAITYLVELSRLVIENEANISKSESDEIINVYRWSDSFLDVIFHDIKNSISHETVENLLKLREELRTKKMFSESDEIRNALKESGIVIEDNKKGSEWYYE